MTWMDLLRAQQQPSTSRIMAPDELLPLHSQAKCRMLPRGNNL